MLVTARSPFSGKYNTRDINVTQKQLDEWSKGGLIQNVMPDLSPDEWDETFQSTESIDVPPVDHGKEIK